MMRVQGGAVQGERRHPSASAPAALSLHLQRIGCRFTEFLFGFCWFLLVFFFAFLPSLPRREDS